LSLRSLAYNASKAAANHLTETLAFEFTTTVKAKVRVNAVAPGVFPSEMTAGGSDDRNQSDLSEKLPTMNIPAARPGETEDMVSLLNKHVQ
jgi:NAD(P)-dependent dehydrogenase (short-subunit alcohol dehydrogenase family)